MKKFFPLVFLSILLFQFTNCDSESKGKFIVTLGTYPSTISTDVQKKTIEILKERLIGIGIDEKDIQILPKGFQFELTISGTNHYLPGLPDRIHTKVLHSEKIEFWETYTLGEVAGPLQEALRFNVDSSLTKNSNVPWDRLAGLIILQYSKGYGEICELGYVKVKDTMEVNRLMDTAIASKKLPHDLRFAWSNAELMNKEPFCKLIFLKTSKNGEARMIDPVIDNVEFEAMGDKMEEISFTMSPFDAKLFQKMTNANVTKNIAFAVDGIVYSWPKVQAEIRGGVFSITGPHQPGDYRKLTNLLRSPSFPVSLYIVSEEVKD